MEFRPLDQSGSTTNPLARHFRQPAIYFRLPSQGAHWPANALTLPAHGEIGIMPMTTRDEITLKTPDALLNGQGVVTVIHSCCPDIRDAWQMPSIDVDATLIAIRIASYGNQMDFETACPHCKTANEYAIDLSQVLSNIQAPNYNVPLEISGLKITLKPQPYASANKTNMIAFEEQQLLRSLGDIEDDPEAAKRRFEQHLNKIIELNVGLLSSSTASIITDDGTVVTDQQYINEFFNNADNRVIKAVQRRLKELSDEAGIKPVDVACLNLECQKEFPVSITFDYSSFFA
jgi:hypothetical protein